MAGFTYGGSALLMDDQPYAFEDDVLQRSTDDDQELDEMVQRNIQDVLKQVGSAGEDTERDLEEAGTSYGLDDYGDAPRQQQGPRSSDPAYGVDTYEATLDEELPTTSAAAARSRASSSTSQRPAQQQPMQQRLQPQSQSQQLRPGARRPAGAAAAAPQRASAVAGAAAGRRASLDPGRRPSDAAQSGAAEAPGGSGTGPNASLLDVPGQPEASLRLHKARIRGLEEELSRANRALLDREKQLTETLRELKELRNQAAGWAREKKALDTQLDRAKRQTAEAEAAARSVETQARDLAKADSRAERERKAAEAEVRARDVRLQRALEEVERYKQLLNEVRAQEREAKGSAAHDSGRLLAENRKLERQRAELITAFKKQLKLIEVLKRQKVHLEAARALQFSEEEFLKTLEMGAT